ncbi:MAG: AsmA-like C-terminal region-containing protein [Rhodospirillales bacterium]|nr:AsmA-like C-terminal region-containing protein [Rhodospirillales bacterium]
MAARLKGSPDKMSVDAIAVSVGRAEQVLLTVKGALADAVGLKGLDVTLAVEGRDIAPFASLAGGPLPKVPPFQIQAGLKDQAGGYLVEGLKVKVGESDLAGRLALVLDGKPPRIDAAITSSLLDLDALLPAGEDKAALAKKAAPDGEKRLFPADPLPLEGLGAAEAKVTLRAKRVVAGGVPIEDLAVDVLLANGRLDVKPLSARLSGGTIGATVDLDGASGDQAALDARVNIKGVDAGALLKTMKLTELLEGGPLDGKIGLTGRGASVRDMMAGLTGEIVVTLGKGRVHNSAIDLAGADLASKAFTSLNPLAEKEEYTELSCGALRFVVKDGMATAKKGIAIQTPKMNIVGDGTVNLKTEEIDFAVKPEARQGLGINLASVAGMVRATGTLAEPTVGLDKLGAATGALSVGTAIATGGLSLLAEGLVGRVTADENACQTALGKTVAAKPAAKPAATKPSTTQTAAPPPPPAEKKEGGFGGFLKDLGKSLDRTLGTKK